jgi:hypothetical protein
MTDLQLEQALAPTLAAVSGTGAPSSFTGKRKKRSLV